MSKVSDFWHKRRIRGNPRKSTSPRELVPNLCQIACHETMYCLDQVGIVLGELAESIDPNKLVTAAQMALIPWAQRLRYLLERLEAGNHAQALMKSYMRNHARQRAILLPTAPQTRSGTKGSNSTSNAEIKAHVLRISSGD